MTIICIKDGVVAADGSSWKGSVLVQQDKHKLCRSKDGAIGGASGFAGDTAAFQKWFADTSATAQRGERLPVGHPLVMPKESNFEAIWIEPDGNVWTVDYEGKPYELGAGPEACGAAWQFAIGAMLAGATAEEAVRICLAYHDCAAGEVQVERLSPVEEKPEELVDIDPGPQPKMFSEEWRQSLGLA